MEKFKPKKENLDKEEMHDIILKDIATHNGFWGDVFNLWMPALGTKEKNIENLQKLQTYEERLKTHGISKPYADFIIQNSNQDKIDKFNKLISTFNDELEEMKKTKNYKRVNEIAEQAFALRD